MDDDMCQEVIYLIEVAERFGYSNRCSTIEPVDNRTGTKRVFVPTLDDCSCRQCTSTLVCIDG